MVIMMLLQIEHVLGTEKIIVYLKSLNFLRIIELIFFFLRLNPNLKLYIMVILIRGY